MKIKNMSLNIFTLILIFLLNITTMKAEAETRGGHYLAGLKSWKTSGSFTRLELDDENISGYVKGKYANIYKELDGKGIIKAGTVIEASFTEISPSTHMTFWNVSPEGKWEMVKDISGKEVQGNVYKAKFDKDITCIGINGYDGNYICVKNFKIYVGAGAETYETITGLKSWKTSGSFTGLELDDENISGYVKGKYANIYKELDTN